MSKSIIKKDEILASLIKLIYSGAALCIIYFAGRGYLQWLDQSPLFKIESIKITGSNYLSDEEILKYLDEQGIKRVKTNDGYKVELHVWGTGTPFREFLFAEDMAAACIYLMENIDFKDMVKVSNIRNDEIRNVSVNIGTGTEISIKGLAYKVKEIIGFKGEIMWDSTKPDGTPRKLLDVTLLETLGWRYSIKLEEGIGLAYHDFLERYE